MDLLYSLQQIRIALPEWINTIFVLISESALILAPVMASVTYWCSDKKKGTYIMCVFAFAMLFNELLKVTFCIYRPWILDPRLFPAVEVIDTATNYSFPSSHSCATASILISLALAYPKNRKLAVFSVVFTLLVMFCRMYLGCHTLKDVCVGALDGAIFAFLFRPMLKEDFNEDRFTKYVAPVTLAVAAVSVLYVLLKPYPMDYQEDGSLLVDFAAMRPDTLGTCGIMAGLGIGLYLERTGIRFEMPESRKAALLRGIPGAIAFALLYAVILKKLFAFMTPAPGKFLRYCFCMLFVAACYPAIFKRCKF